MTFHQAQLRGVVGMVPHDGPIPIAPGLKFNGPDQFAKDIGWIIALSGNNPEETVKQILEVLAAYGVSIPPSPPPPAAP